jgi:hypothetical protein
MMGWKMKKRRELAEETEEEDVVSHVGRGVDIAILGRHVEKCSGIATCSYHSFDIRCELQDNG